ncbi:hypothetical protein ILYODFUR_024237 [Ilyodon furcidens]|uniref:Uncharacterized protein n=1 Tax=Ilyodon furcidens TaxID=33524 RepID=A0ABV0T2D4_9TELE
MQKACRTRHEAITNPPSKQNYIYRQVCTILATMFVHQTHLGPNKEYRHVASMSHGSSEFTKNNNAAYTFFHIKRKLHNSQHIWCTFYSSTHGFAQSTCAVSLHMLRPAVALFR